MRIAIGSLQCEGNSLTPVLTRKADFDLAYGPDMLAKLQIAELLEEKQIEVVPTLYAHALPGGPVAKADYLELAGGIVDGVPVEGIDGVWLYLHGAMCVEGIGSGEAYLLRRLREKIGFEIPVAVAMDFHADNSDEIPQLANYVTGFRTAPHADHKQTQLRALQALIICVEKHILPRPQISRAAVVIEGDAVQTAQEPLRSIMAEAERMEREIPGMLGVQVFNGQPWIDEPYMGPNFIVTHESDTAVAKQCADRLARMYYDARHDFRFTVEALEPEEAIRRAMQAPEHTVFLSDSGDNPAAGAAGDNAYLLNRLMQAGAKNVLVAGIMDAAACARCYEAQPGDTLELTVGGSLDKRSESAVIRGRLIGRGDLLSYQRDNAGPCAMLDCGGITVAITKNRAAFCRPDIFASVGLDYTKYHIVVVKLGYLFPELAEEAERSILAFTPGASTERLQDMHMQNIRRPMYPLDDNFME